MPSPDIVDSLVTRPKRRPPPRGYGSVTTHNSFMNDSINSKNEYDLLRQSVSIPETVLCSMPLNSAPVLSLVLYIVIHTSYMPLLTMLRY